MKKISLKTMALTNFKGIKSLEIVFDKNATSIYGDNATGKTTIFDAFTWLLFGKDHTDSAKIEVKTVDKFGNAIPKLQHEVEVKLLVNNDSVLLKRVYKEKWTKIKGSLDAILTGHETSYFYNDVPVSMSEYNQKIGELINEQLFKLITNPFNFSSLPWTYRRDILTSITGIESDEDIALKHAEFGKLLDEMDGKSFDDFKRILGAKKKKIKDELDEIPTRIDEAYKALPESKDWDAIRLDIEKKETDSKDLMKQIIDNSKVDEAHSLLVSEKLKVVSKFQNEKNLLEGNARMLVNNQEQEHRRSVNEKSNKVQEIEYKITNLDSRISVAITDKQAIESKLAFLRQDYDNEDDKKFVVDESQLSCPTCKREFEAFAVKTLEEELQSNFNTEKVKNLELLNVRGKHLKSELEKIEKLISEHESNQLVLKKELESAEKELALTSTFPKAQSLEELLDNDIYNACTANLLNAEKDVYDLRNEPINKDIDLIKSLELKREGLLSEIQTLNKTLYQEEQLSQGNARIKSLEESGALLGSELSVLEGKEFLIEKFTSIKMNQIEDTVNAMFTLVKFKLFKEQLNGGIAECCDILIDGVPFDSANNAGKIKGGIEIINVLTDYHKIQAPIFVDNAESIVIIPETKSQLITLVVSEKHKSLTIN